MPEPIETSIRTSHEGIGRDLPDADAFKGLHLGDYISRDGRFVSPVWDLRQISKGFSPVAVGSFNVLSQGVSNFQQVFVFQGCRHSGAVGGNPLRERHFPHVADFKQETTTSNLSHG